jgi:integrase
LLQELLNYWRAQRQGKAGHNSPWLFLGKKAGQPMSTYAGQNIYYSALKKSGVRYKGGIHTLRHYPEFRTITCKLEVSAPNPLLAGLGAASIRESTRHSPVSD